VILVADIGNTNIKIGIFDGDKLVDSVRLATSAAKTADEYWMMLKDMLKAKGVAISEISGAIMSSVNPNLNYTVEHMIKANFDFKPLVVGAGLKTGLNILYDNPREVGSDRILGAVAAYNTYGGPCIVIDCGTATVFNAIGEKGEFLGGAIGFGLKTASEALSQSAAKLPKVELTAPASVINRNTIGNMQSGIVYGFIGAVEYIVGRMKTEMKCGGAIKVIATGGLSEIITRHTKIIDIVDRTLTLRGLNIIYRLNT
jgi:type III pantothenate kinase